MSQSKPRDSTTDSACHVLKGAIVKVLGTPITISVECNNKVKGRISVEYDHPEKPSQELINKIEQEANLIIKQNLEFKTFKIDKKEAESKYKSNLVNNTYIYDKFPVPESVTELSLVELENWNINCCPAVHLKTTGEIGGIKIGGINHRPAKKELEFRFDIVAAVVSTETTTKPTGRGAPKKTAVVANEPSVEGPSLKDTNVQYLTQKIIKLVLDSKDNEKEQTTLEIEQLLTILKNTSYTNGSQSVIISRK
ncbi:hypothetical protein RB653_010379 [Dictyostelium firmibasis]|uniref:Threonyl/alanyl tRNA synthetase SAD domain-containing protein n=1 Tax=Dictyostelium firmibasis TaxID=79012 RepID=A0AAN7TTW6_9MYCE